MSKTINSYGAWREDDLEKVIVLLNQGISFDDIIHAFAAIDPHVKFMQMQSQQGAVDRLKYALRKYNKTYLKPQSWLKWRTIYSAPRDGSKFLGVQNGDIYVLSWDGENFIETGGNVIRPDHWMSLPAPPRYIV